MAIPENGFNLVCINKKDLLNILEQIKKTTYCGLLSCLIELTHPLVH